MTSLCRQLSIIALALVTALVAVPIAAHAQVLDDSGAAGAIDSAIAPTAPETEDSRIGAAAAMACGFFARLSTAPGGPYTGAIVGAVASCLFMVLDAFVFDPPSS